jgi:hypothetical protein
MTFTEIKSAILPLWGDEIDISDAEEIDLGEGETGFVAPALSALWNKIEKQAGYNDPYRELMVWTIYQHLHAMAREMFESEEYKLDPQSINLRTLEEQYYRNMDHKVWKFLKADYERI